MLLPCDGSGAYDMTVELEELARDTLGENCLVEIAMGTDETEKATESVMQAARNGHWTCLKNIHLVSSWLPVLDRLMNELDQEDGGLHVNFRLWMTAEPVSTLPVSLLQRCKKIVSEVNCKYAKTLFHQKLMKHFQLGSARNEAQLESHFRSLEPEFLAKFSYSHASLVRTSLVSRSGSSMYYYFV